MEKGDKGTTMIRTGVSGWMFLLVPAYPGCPGSKAVKRLLLFFFFFFFHLFWDRTSADKWHQCLSVTQPTVSKHWSKHKIEAWPCPFFICHQTADVKGFVPFTWLCDALLLVVWAFSGAMEQHKTLPGYNRPLWKTTLSLSKKWPQVVQVIAVQ